MANNSSFSSSIAFIILFLLNAALLYYLSLAHGRTCAEIGYPISTTFDRESPLQDLGATGDKAWIELTPARGGFLWVQTNIENSKEGHAKEEEWGISMFHGLHCLQMLRGAFRQVVGINETGEARQDLRAVGPRSGASRAHAHAALDIVHIGHCLGYLADYLTCHADSTLEPPVREYAQDGRLSSSVDGLGYQHQCRDTKFMWDISVASERRSARPWSWRPGQRVEDLVLQRGI